VWPDALIGPKRLFGWKVVLWSWESATSSAALVIWIAISLFFATILVSPSPLLKVVAVPQPPTELVENCVRYHSLLESWCMYDGSLANGTQQTDHRVRSHLAPNPSTRRTRALGVIPVASRFDSMETKLLRPSAVLSTPWLPMRTSAAPQRHPKPETKLRRPAPSGSSPLEARPAKKARGSATWLPVLAEQSQMQDTAVTPAAPLDGSSGANKRAVRAARRGKLHRGAAAAARDTRLTFLEANAVRPQTVTQYTDYVERFRQWLPQHGAEVTSVSVLDVLLCEFFEDLYFHGHNHDVADKTLAAIQFCSLGIRLKQPCELPRAVRAARGFRRLAPGHSRAPLPWVALVALATTAAATGLWEMAVALVLQFVCYLRPSELLGLEVGNVSFPSEAARLKGVALLLFPEEGLVTGKTKEFDESVIFDREELMTGMCAALRSLMRGKPKGAKLFSLTYASYVQNFHQLAEISGVSALQPHPYALRHGGASDDYLTKKLDLEGVRRKGRWRSFSSVRRYEKSGRVAAEVQRLPVKTRAYALRNEARLNRVLAKSVVPEPPPDIHRGKLQPSRQSASAVTRGGRERAPPRPG